MNRNRLAALLAGLCLSSLSAGAARADILVDHPPSDSFGEASDTSFHDEFGDPLWQQFTDNFSLATSATVGHVTWWGFYGAAFGLSNHPPVGDETMRIRFYAARAADGLPGQVLYEESVLNPQRVATGRNVAVGNDVPEFKFDVNLADPVQIDANTTYWLEVVQVGLPDSLFRWQNALDPGDGDAFMNQDLSDWYFIPYGELAFQLSNTPEPVASIGILVVSISGFLFRRGKEAR